MPARILVVDDDPWILRMVSATLTKRGYVCETGTDGQQALEKARAHPPDVLITDLMMPVMDGWALVQQLRGIPPLASIPIIFLTALGKDEARLQSLGLGPDDYLAKPFRFADLEKRVSAALQKPTRAASTPESQVGPLPPQGAYPGAYPAHVPPGYPPSHESQVGPLPGYPHGYPPGYPPYYPPQGYPPAGYPPQGYPPPPAAAPTASPPPAHTSTSEGPPPAPPASASGRTIEGVQVPRRSTALNGRLEQLGLSSLLVMMEMERKDGVLTLKDGKSGVIGRIFLRRGQVVCARLDDEAGTGDKQCVYEMLVWRGGTFSFNAMEVDMEDTVQSSTTHLLMEGARLIDEANRDEGL
jgi:CheY-like chemotaxis protein